MKKLVFLFTCILSLGLVPALAQSPINGVVWDNSGASATGPSTFTTLPATISPGAFSVNVSQWDRVGVTYNAAGACYNSKDWSSSTTLAGAVTDGTYIYFTVTNDANTELEVTQVHLDAQTSGTGPQTIQMQYSIGAGGNMDFGSAMPTGATGSGGPYPATFDFNGIAHVCPGQTATFKVYGWGAAPAGLGTFRINDNTSMTATWAPGPVSIAADNTASFGDCPGFDETLEGFDFGGGVGPYTYSWSGPAGYSSTDQFATVPSASAVNAGTYTFTETDAYGCSSSTTTDLVLYTAPDTTMTITGALSFCTPPGSVTFTVPFDPFYDYYWFDVSSGFPSLVDFGPNTYTTSSSGQYYVEIDDVFGTGCSSLSDTFTVTATAAPSALVTASGPTTLCSPATVTLSVPAGGGGYTYQWYNTSGAISGATNSSYNVSASGTYSVTVINGACSATSSGTTVTINAGPTTPSVSPAGPLSICSGTPTTLTSTTQTGVTYKWWRGSTAIPGATNTTYVPLITGTYSMVVTSTLTGCTATSNGVTVTLNPSPSSTITANPGTTICSGSSVTLSTPFGPVNTYQWLDGSNMPIAGATNSTYNTTTAGTYRVVVTNTTTGCFDTTTAPGTTLTVQASPAASDAVISPAGPFTICSNDSVVLSTPGTTPGLSYQWYRPGSIAGATNSSYTARISGTYTVRITNSAGCSTTSASSVSITVNPAPSAAVTVTGSTTFCAPGSVDLSATTGAGYTYQWYNGTTPVAGATNSTFTDTSSGTFHAVITAPNTCVTTSNATTVTVIPTPYIIVSGSPSFCAGNSVLLTASTAGIPGVIYQWKRNGVNIPGAVSATYAANVTGTYTCFVNIPGGCATLTTASVINVFPTVFPTVTFDGTYVSTHNFYATYQWYINAVTIPGATSYRYAAYTNAAYRVMITDTNGCQLLSDDYEIFNLGVDNANGNQQVSVYPNPATSTVHVEAAGTVKVVISSVDGKMLMEGTNKNDLNIGGLANGLYMILVYNDKGDRLHVEKLVKQ